MSNDPFRSDINNQLMREARIGLTALAVMLALFAYVAWFKITQPTRLPESVAAAPLATQVWPGQEQPPGEPRSLSESFADLLDSTREVLTSGNGDRPPADGTTRQVVNARGNDPDEIRSGLPQRRDGEINSTVPSRVVANGSGAIVNSTDDSSDPQTNPARENPVSIAASVPTIEQFENSLDAAPPAFSPLAAAPADHNRAAAAVVTGPIENNAMVPGSFRRGTNDSDVRLAGYDNEIASLPQHPIQGLSPARPPVVETSAARSPALQTTSSPGAFQPAPQSETGRGENAAPSTRFSPSTSSSSQQQAAHSRRQPVAIRGNDSDRPSAQPTMPSLSFNELRSNGANTALNPPAPAVDIATMPVETIREEASNASRHPLNERAGTAEPANSIEPVISREPAYPNDIPLQTENNAQAASSVELPTPRMELPQGRSVYVISENDSFYSISQRYYNDGRLYRALYYHNRQNVDCFETPQPGLEISIPPIDELVRLWSEHCPEDLLRHARPLTEASHRLYLTETGDTLFEIARDRLGQASRYFEIMQINEVRLPDSTDHLSPLPAGIRLVLPVENQ